MELERFRLVPRAVRSHRPVRADQPHVRQRLLEDHPAPVSVMHDEDEVEVAVTNLLDLGDRTDVDLVGEQGIPADVAGDRVCREELVRHRLLRIVLVGWKRLGRGDIAGLAPRQGEGEDQGHHEHDALGHVLGVVGKSLDR